MECLFALLVERVLLAEGAILVELETIGIVPLILHGIVVPLLALSARERNFNALSCGSHNSIPSLSKDNYAPQRRRIER
jgi:hypothetical protein